MSEWYPPVSFYFSVTIAGIQTHVDYAFMEASGLDAELSVFELKEGGENRFTHRLPERARYHNLILKRGLMLASSKLATWCKQTLESDLSGRIETHNINLMLLDPNGKTLMVWNFYKAWPVKWSISTFNAQANEIAVETIEFAYTYCTRESKQAAPNSVKSPSVERREKLKS